PLMPMAAAPMMPMAAAPMMPMGMGMMMPPQAATGSISMSGSIDMRVLAMLLANAGVNPQQLNLVLQMAASGQLSPQVLQALQALGAAAGGGAAGGQPAGGGGPPGGGGAFLPATT